MSKSQRFTDNITRRLEALEKEMAIKDGNNNATALDELLDGLANHNSEQIAAAICKPKKDKAADPELEKLFDSYVEYKKSATHSSDLHEEIILE